ncbi:nesprin-2a isoform 1-T4 [Syngnathus typhle]
MSKSKSSGKSSISVLRNVRSSDSSGLPAYLNLYTYPHSKQGAMKDNDHPNEQTQRNKYLIPKRFSGSSGAEEESELLSLEAKEMAEIREEMRLEKPACEHSSSMQELLSEVQGMVERNNIINRTTHMDLNWYLQSSPSEAEIRLVRAVQNVLACRYLPAQLDVAAMSKQLEKAEGYNRCVLDQVATMKSSSQCCDPNVLKRLEAQWSTALLDASATVQVKSAQLDEVKQYHKQLEKVKAFLEDVDAEKKKIELSTLGSSALQAEKLCVLLQTLKESEEMWQELRALSSPLAVHLSDAESSGALLAQLGDVQDEWRLLSGSIRRALYQAANSSCQSSALRKEAQQLQNKIEVIRESKPKSTFELLCLSEDLKMCNQLLVHLQSFSDALSCIGQKEKNSIKHDLEELRTLLATTKNKSSLLSTDANKQFQEWITWAKQMEYSIIIGKKMSLFPEEARIQIDKMRKYQTDIRIRSKIQLEEMREEKADMDNVDYAQALNIIKDLYETLAKSLENVLDAMQKNLEEIEELLDHLDSIDRWLVETKANRDSRAYVENVSRVDIGSLESNLKHHREVADDIESHLSLVDSLEKKCKEVGEDLSPGESRHLVNRLSAIRTEFDGLLAQASATGWHLEELIHERTSSGEELSTIEDSLKDISSCLDRHHFPMTQENILAISLVKHMLMEHQCQVQEIQHCQEMERSSLLCTIGELQDRCKVLSFHALEQDKYLQLKKQMEDSRDVSEKQIQQANDRTRSLGERFKLCQALLVDLPLMKTQCQEAADQLEVIAQELNPTELEVEKQSIHSIVEMFISWEHTATHEMKHLEGRLLLGLSFSSELPALMEFFQRTAQELQGMLPVRPDERSIDVELQRRWAMWRNTESGMRVLHALTWKENIDWKSHTDLQLLRDSIMQECHSQMERLSKTRESLKDYQWAAQGAINFLHNAQLTFLSAPGGFLDCTEEQTQTQQAMEALEEGFLAHIQHLVELVPRQVCLSRSETQDLHIGILSQLLVGRAILEAQAHLRLESLQRCELRQLSHRVCHQDVQKRLIEFEAKLSTCAAKEVTSYDKRVAQHSQSKDLMEGVFDLARQIEELRERCPMQGCGIGKDGELGAVWRRWVSLRRRVGLLMAQADQRVEEWKDITVIELTKDLSNQKVVLKGIQDSVLEKSTESPAESVEETEKKLMEQNVSVQKVACQVTELISGLEQVKLCLEQKSWTLTEAQQVLKHVWDKLDSYHSRLMLLESEVQDLVEKQSDQAHLFMDQLTRPLRLYQDAVQMAEHRTAFLNKIPASLQEFEDLLCGATCWFHEAQAWLRTPCSFPTSKDLQNHAKSLQLVLDDSARIRSTLKDFRHVLAEICIVCDLSAQEERMDNTDLQVQKMQKSIQELMVQLKRAVEVVEALEEELNTLEANIPKIRTILSSMDNSSITVNEHLRNQQVILDNVHSMQKTLEDIDNYKEDLRLPQETKESLVVFSGIKVLLQVLGDLETLTQQQAVLLETNILKKTSSEGLGLKPCVDVSNLDGAKQRYLINFEESSSEDDLDDESCHSSSSDTLTSSIPEDPDDTLYASEVPSDDIIVKESLSDAKVFAQISEPVSEGEKSGESSELDSKKFPSMSIILARSSKDDTEQQRWSLLQYDIFQKLETLQKLQEEHQNPKSYSKVAKVPEGKFDSASDVLQHANESVATLSKIMISTDDPGKLYLATQQVLQCMDALTDLLLTPGSVEDEETQLRILKHDCVSMALVSLSGLLHDVEAKISPEADVLSCLTSLQECLKSAQLVISDFNELSFDSLILESQCQELFSNHLCFMEELQLDHREVFPSQNENLTLEECVLGRHVSGCSGEKAMIQKATHSFLHGIRILLDLGEECIAEGQKRPVQNINQLHVSRQRNQKFQQVLGAQLTFLQHLFHRKPEAMRGQEDEQAQLEVRGKDLLQQSLQQEVAFQWRLQEWNRWEDNCARLGSLLDKVEVRISSTDAEDDEESHIQRRLRTCQQTLVQLETNRGALGQLLDQKCELRTDPSFGRSIRQTGGALELRWRNICTRMEQEVRRWSNILDGWVRFQTDFSSVSKWLLDANKHLKIWSELTGSSHVSQESVCRALIGLLDFSVEMEVVSAAHKEAASREAARLLRLRETECPGLRRCLAKMEESWCKITFNLTNAQEQLQKKLLLMWPPMKLLTDLEDWLKKLEVQVEQEQEQVHKATDAGQIRRILQRYKALKITLVNGQQLLEFLSQTRRQVMGMDVQAHLLEPTMYEEKLGALRQLWLHFQGALEKQIHEAQELQHFCATREKLLQHLHQSLEQQKKHLNQWKCPTCQTQTQKVLHELETVVGRIKEMAAALQGANSTHVEKEHPCDVVFCDQAEAVSLACEDLSLQIRALEPTLQQSVKEWACLERNLREVSLQTSRVHSTMKLYGALLFSLKQTEAYLELLQQLQKMCSQGQKLWANINKSLQILLKTLDGGAAQLLNDRIEQEQKRWEDMLEKLNEELQKTDKTLPLWQKYNQAFDNGSLQLEHLRSQFSSFSPRQEPQVAVNSAEKLQNFAEDLQNHVADVLALSKPLIGCLKPPVQKMVQSERTGLSLEVQLLNRAMSDTKKSLQEGLDNYKLFHKQLDALEQQTQNLLDGEKSNMNDKDIVKQELLRLLELLPSLVDVSELSGDVTLNKQEKDRLHMLNKKWTHGVNDVFFLYRTLQREHQHSQDFHQKYQEVTFILEELESELPSGFNHQEILAVHQRRQIKVITGHELLQSLLCNAIKSLEKEKSEERSELLTRAVHLRERWFGFLMLAGQHRASMREHISQRTIFKRGMKLLRNTLRVVDTLLSITTLPATSQHHCQCINEALEHRSTILTATLETGRRLCEVTSDSDSRSRLESDIQAVEGAWKHTNSLVQKRRSLVSATLENWSRCQDDINGRMCEVDELRTQLKRPIPVKMDESEEEELIQKTDVSLRHLAGGLKDLTSMKTDLSQYVAAADSALLEQQLEQLHIQWEELCAKVSLRRQEIADRLNAWTIFNDKKKEFCHWLTQIENKVCYSADLSIEEMVEKLKKDCMEEINLFSENKSHLKQLGEQLLLASDEAKQTQVCGSLQEVNQRWHNLFSHIEARVTKLKETLLRVQQLDKNMSNLRSWLSRVEAELSRPITYSVCHHQEIQRRLAEQQELQRDIEQHTEGVTSVLNLCDLLLRDEDAAGIGDVESDSLQETSHSLDQRWRTIRAMALDRRLRIEETWRLWCKFLEDYSQFEDWLKMAEKSAANPNTGDVLYTVAKEELKKFEGFQRQVHERLTQLELVNNQYRRLTRENRTDRASQLKAMVHEGNRRWDVLHRRVAVILRRLKHFTSQREEFESTRESMLVWLTELDLQLTNVEHFSESDVHHKIQQLSSFQKEIIFNTEQIDGLIVFGESLIQKSSPQDAALIEEELEELHSYCQEVFSRLVRFHQRLSQPPIIAEEPETSGNTFSLESSLELIGRPWLGRSQGSLPATPSHLLTFPLEHSGRETPVSVDSLPLEWDHTGDVGGSSSHEDDEDDGRHDEEGIYFSALSVSSRSMGAYESPIWRSPEDEETDVGVGNVEAPPTLTSTPIKQQMFQCGDNIQKVSLMLDDEKQAKIGLTNLDVSDSQSGVIERWELLQAQSRNEQDDDPQQNVTSDLDDVISWLDNIHPELDRLHQSHPSNGIVDMATRAKEMKEMQKMFTHYKPIMLSVNLRALQVPEQQEKLVDLNQAWSRASTLLHQWENNLRRTLMCCQEFHESLHSLLLWLPRAENRRYQVDILDPETPVQILKQHHRSLTALVEELLERQTQQASLHTLWTQLQPEDGDEAQEKLHVTGSKLKSLLNDVTEDLRILQHRLECEIYRDQNIPGDSSEDVKQTKRRKRDSSPPRSFFCRVLQAAVPFHLLLLFLLFLPCLLPRSEIDSSCTVTNNFARSFHPMLHYTNGPPPT